MKLRCLAYNVIERKFCFNLKKKKSYRKNNREQPERATVRGERRRQRNYSVFPRGLNVQLFLFLPKCSGFSDRDSHGELTRKIPRILARRRARSSVHACFTAGNCIRRGEDGSSHHVSRADDGIFSANTERRRDYCFVKKFR